ncbi:SPOC like C-terminal domain-containing protein [Coniella lustricola]|uniref:ATP-dependent DNA helicase II subunit 1 n=1 Tax=Coniella lustricola TaxID=2025994 RepID=A0A2T3ABY0_9PEZI|nr:SPOC like C-terminal domain-containing protein [Coniella lustricola]
MPYNREEGDQWEEEDGDEEIDENDYKTQKDAVLFAIEVSKSTLEVPDDGKDRDSVVQAALKSASLMMQQRIIAQPKDMMGLIFFGTEESKFRDKTSSASHYPHCYVQTDLDVPSAEVVRALKDIAENRDDPNGILRPSEGMPPIRDMLFCANQIFTTGAPNFGSRRLFIVTDNDDPFAGDKKMREQAAVRAKDLFDLGVTIELFPISRAGWTFDLDKFYTDIIYLDPLQVAVDPDSVDDIKAIKPKDGISLLQSLSSSITAKQAPKRAYFSNMPFELAPGMTISVNGYLLMHRQVVQRNCYVYLEDENSPPQIVKGETLKTEEGSMRTVEKTELKKAYKFGVGGDLVYFTPRELQQIKEFEPKCLRIIGFKPRSMLPPWAAIKKSTFIFPTEAGFVGSTRVFSALWQKLLDSKKMAIAWHVPRKNAAPQIVAILPSHKPSEEDAGTNYLPAGLWLYPLPFVDDRRDLTPLKQQPVVRASDELVTQMRTIVQNLQLPKDKYDPSKFPNPALQYHYTVLQALALDEDVPPATKFPDHTLPRFKQINKRVGGYQSEFKERVEEEARTVMQQLAIKRDAEEEADDRPKKKSRIAVHKAAPGGGTTWSDLNKAINDGSLSKRTVADLKDICSNKGLSTNGRKADLLERIEQWIEEQA